ncbi:alpha/beta fold hydrolase [Mucilaginibacter sp. FT3.2]|uniref:alpha/beta fold hydrolase n=1 Tax=Mucilaginibacter sp. FT3.2 TaxID=2723090 RepID=UPI001613C3D2|nr:alpha/beta hydrolase [Mucilaginibacter sp. FT3.2]MBB6231669.1 pimeloyl-ACP methyl ester carboxylesterase [Mucilaginibacter sp. FT3.2]
MKKITASVLAALLMLIVCHNGFARQTVTGSFYTAPDGVKIYYEVKGDGFPVVLIHGFSGTGEGWKSGPLYKDLLDAGYKVIVLDQRGNGRSDKPHTDAGYANDAEAKDVIGLVSSLGIKKYNVVGYSRGSIIASRLLVLDKRVRKLVMGGMGDGYTNPEWPRRVHAYKALMGDTSFHDVDGMVKYIHSNPAFDVPALALQQKYQPSTSAQELAKVKIQVPLIDGAEDHDNGSETELHKMIPTSKLSYVPGDHNSASKTVQFSADVLGFFK